MTSKKIKTKLQSPERNKFQNKYWKRNWYRTKGKKLRKGKKLSTKKNLPEKIENSEK